MHKNSHQHIVFQLTIKVLTNVKWLIDEFLYI